MKNCDIPLGGIYYISRSDTIIFNFSFYIFNLAPNVSEERKAPALCKHMVSGLFHRPRRAAFHLSLTVLVHYR